MSEVWEAQVFQMLEPAPNYSVRLCVQLGGPKSTNIHMLGIDKLSKEAAEEIAQVLNSKLKR